MAGLGEVYSRIGALLFYLESASCVSKSCTQIGCGWKEPSGILDAIPYAEIADISFEKPKSQIAGCKRGAHLYSDAVPLNDLQQPIEGTEMFVEEVACSFSEDLASNELVELPSTSFPLVTVSIDETSIHQRHLCYQLQVVTKHHHQVHLCYQWKMDHLFQVLYLRVSCNCYLCLHRMKNKRSYLVR